MAKSSQCTWKSISWRIGDDMQKRSDPITYERISLMDEIRSIADERRRKQDMKEYSDLESMRQEHRKALQERIERISMDIESVKGALIEVRELSSLNDKRLEELLWEELDALMKVKQCIEKRAIMCGSVLDMQQRY